MEKQMEVYEAPAVDAEISTEDLEREVHYAGFFSGPIDIVPN